MKSLEQNCTLLVNSCDSYSDCWDGFFALLKIQWKNFSMPVVLNTESLSYDCEGLNVRTLQLYQKGKNPSWGKRLIETLKRIDTKYVLFALDDFYLSSPVREDVLEQCYAAMEKNEKIAYFSFLYAPDDKAVPSKDFPGFERRTPGAAYTLNCQFALWNREKLLHYVRAHESPWEWELYGSRRTARGDDVFYSLCKDAAPVFDYLNGSIVMRGRWYMARVKPLIEQYHLQVDLSRRGSYEEFVQSEQPAKRKLLRGIKNRVHKILSLV